MADYRNSPTINFCANVLPAHIYIYRCPSIKLFFNYCINSFITIERSSSRTTL